MTFYFQTLIDLSTLQKKSKLKYTVNYRPIRNAWRVGEVEKARESIRTNLQR